MMAIKRNGALPDQTLLQMIEDGLIIGADEACIQPSSMDLPI